jgi:DUF1365 family protein
VTGLYRTRVTHMRRTPGYHYLEQRGYSWYVDLDAMPQLPGWFRPFATFEAADHLSPPPAGEDTLRSRVDHYLAERDIELPGGAVTALLQARVFGHVFNPLSVFWCHDSQGVLRHVIAEVHSSHGGRHAYLLPPTGDQPAAVKKALDVAPAKGVEGYYLVRAPRPDAELDVSISLHRENKPAFVATVAGTRLRPSSANLLRQQMVAPAAPLAGAMWVKTQCATLRARRLPAMPQAVVAEREKVGQL